MPPNFLIIGAQKAATTSLWAYLRSHPERLPAGLQGAGVLRGRNELAPGSRVVREPV